MEKLIKDNIKVGIGTMGGSMVLGSLGSLPGMPAQAQTSLNMAQSGLNLAGVGMLGKTAISVTKMLGKK